MSQVFLYTVSVDDIKVDNKKSARVKETGVVLSVANGEALVRCALKEMEYKGRNVTVEHIIKHEPVAAFIESGRAKSLYVMEVDVNILVINKKTGTVDTRREKRVVSALGMRNRPREIEKLLLQHNSLQNLAPVLREGSTGEYPVNLTVSYTRSKKN